MQKVPETCKNFSLRDQNLLLSDEFWVTNMPIKPITYITGQGNVVAFLYHSIQEAHYVPMVVKEFQKRSSVVSIRIDPKTKYFSSFSLRFHRTGDHAGMVRS
jgi:hypothetical protein